MRKKEKKPMDARKRRKWIGIIIVLAVCLTVAVLINMVVIFLFSAESKEDSGERSTGIARLLTKLIHPDLDEMDKDARHELMLKTQHFVRKAAHFLEYALLGFLLTGLFRYIDRYLKKLWRWVPWVAPPVICLAYAISDEVHQIFSDRGPSPIDVLIDFSGALFGIALMHLILWLFRRHRRRKESRSCKTPITE